MNVPPPVNPSTSAATPPTTVNRKKGGCFLVGAIVFLATLTIMSLLGIPLVLVFGPKSMGVGLTAFVVLFTIAETAFWWYAWRGAVRYRHGDVNARLIHPRVVVVLVSIYALASLSVGIAALASGHTFGANGIGFSVILVAYAIRDARKNHGRAPHDGAT